MQEITAKFTNHLKEALAKSLAFAVESQQNTVCPIHLLWALALQSDSIAAKILKDAGVTREKLEEYIANQEMKTEIPVSIPNLAEDTKVIIEKAVIAANTHGHTYISTEHLLSGMLQVQPDEVIRFFTQANIDTQDVHTKIKRTLNMTIQVPIEQPNEELKVENEEIVEQETALEYFTKELTSEESLTQQTPVIGREAEMHRLSTILGRKTKNNPVLLGDPGVGKSAIVEGLAQKIARGEIKTLKDHKVYSLNLSLLLAGTMYRGSFEARIQHLVSELESDPLAILFIDEMHTLVGSGSNGGSMDAANILKPSLARGTIRCIGATTYEEYKKWIESDGALERRFQKIKVEEPTRDETREILRGISKSYGSHHKVNYTNTIVDTILELADIHFPDKNFPDKAIDVMDEIGSLASQKSKTIKKVSQSLVIEALSHMTGLPESTLKRQKTKDLKNLGKTLTGIIAGQDKVIKSVTHSLQKAHIGLGDEHKPHASFLFVGSSGVGKTELAKQIARNYFQGPRPILRLDMSEYKEGFQSSKLLGSPAGYVGYKDTNVLADHIRNYPHSVILFDEIEKAHPDIHNLLLQILEEGSIRDATGRKLSFAHSIVILTSNAGQELFTRGAMGFGSESAINNSEIRSKLEEMLRPELLNRLDSICAFEELTPDTLKKIAERELEQLSEKLAKRQVTCTFQSRSIETIAQGASRQHGARGISRYIARHIEPLIVKQLLKNSKIKSVLIEPGKNNQWSLK